MSDTTDAAAADALARRAAAVMYERDTAARHLGIAVEDVGPGRAVLAMTIDETMLNGHDVCHGGYLFTLADTAFAYACNSQNEAALAQGASIDFLRPGRAGELLTATAVQQQQGRRTGLYDVSVTNAAGQCLALFRGRAFRVGGSVTRENNE